MTRPSNPTISEHQDISIIRGLFTDDVHHKILDYMTRIVPLMSCGIDTDQFVRRYIHNPHFFVSIHHQLSEFASELFGEKLKPSYSFLSMYEDNGICPLHIDRPQCYRTIDYLIRQDSPESWPIKIGRQMTDDQRRQVDESGLGHPSSEEEIQERINNEEWTEVLLHPNDAVLYSGTHSWHYRPQRLQGKADLVFFHFVREDFDGPLD